MSAILKFIRENHILALIEQAVARRKSRLSLNAFEIDEIPNVLYSCVDIEQLYLHMNSITTVPVEITQLTQLTTLTLDYNNISELPPEIGKLKNLVNLNISYNPLKVLIPEICELENLEAFWCNKIGLREIPADIGKLVKLDTFGARGNELKCLPDEIGSLTKLRWLTLEKNELESLPSSVAKMVSLVHCNLKSNNFSVFPVELLQCVELMYIQLNKNKITSLPENIDTSFLSELECIDMRDNPVCSQQKLNLPQVRFTEDPLPDRDLAQPSSSRSRQNPGRVPPNFTPQENVVLAVNGTQIRLQPPAPNQPANQNDPVILEVELDSSSSVASSEDWENSVNSSELDMQYQSDEERIENEAVGSLLPHLSRYASTAS